MATKHVAHWLGSSVNQLPLRAQQACNAYFTVIEHGNDVSILSEPNIHYAVFSCIEKNAKSYCSQH